MQCNAMQCDEMQCDAMRCDAMRCDAMQCNAMQHRITPQHDVIYLMGDKKGRDSDGENARNNERSV